MLITFNGVAFGYGDNLIFGDVSFSLNEGERTGLIGANGEGKTTLIKLLIGELYADGGEIVRKNGIKIGYLEQNGGYSSGNTVYDEMLGVFSEELGAVEKLAALSEELSRCPYTGREYDALSKKIEALEKYVSAKDCYNVDVRIKTVLNGMGFSDMYDRIIDTMSGGEKTRLKLARLLLESPDLLVLDEPTNHLDTPTLFWLEEYLQAFKGAVFVVSHDRYFLDKTVRRILEIENKKLESFSGNYTKYKTLKAELYARRLKEYEAQREERAKLQEYVDKNLVRASTAKSALSRVKQLEKMEILEKPYCPPKPPEYNFGYDIKSYEQVLDMENLDLERGGKRLISAGQLHLRRGERLALVGANGTGKSSLLKEITGGNPAIRTGRFVKIAYYDQEGANLNGDNAVLSELWERHVGYTQTEARAALARCGLFAADMQKSVKSLSGGERAKLALCILECERGNFLLLDEPTNHLDLPAREALERALAAFDGALIFVSHDRYFISALATSVAEIEGGRLAYYPCGYAEFTERKAEEERAKRDEAERISKMAAEKEREIFYRSKKERAEEERRKREIKQIEADICALERSEEEINAALSLPENLADYKRVLELSEKLQSVKLQLDALYSRYADMIQ